MGIFIPPQSQHPMGTPTPFIDESYSADPYNGDPTLFDENQYYDQSNCYFVQIHAKNEKTKKKGVSIPNEQGFNGNYDMQQYSNQHETGLLNEESNWYEFRSMAEPNHAFPITFVKFDDFEELLWIGYQSVSKKSRHRFEK